MPRLKIFFDGGCRPNPGAMEIALVIAGRAEVVRGIGSGSSSDAEWLALIHALQAARGLADHAGGVVLLGDAANVIDQAQGRARCRGAALRHLAVVRELGAAAGDPPIRYVGRSHNLAGIALQRLHPR